MPDLMVVAVITAKPDGVDAVRSALTDLVSPTRAEAGCRSYDLYESGTEAGVFVTVEQWSEQADLDAHMQTPHVAQAFAAAGDQMALPPSIHALTPVVVG